MEDRLLKTESITKQVNIEQSGPKPPIYAQIQYQQSYSTNYICEHILGVKEKTAFVIGSQRIVTNAKSLEHLYPILTHKKNWFENWFAWTWYAVLINLYQRAMGILIRKADFPLSVITTNKICNCWLRDLRGFQFWTARKMHTFQDEYKLLSLFKEPSFFHYVASKHLSNWKIT